jgi:hypothetical protein
MDVQWHTCATSLVYCWHAHFPEQPISTVDSKTSTSHLASQKFWRNHVQQLAVCGLLWKNSFTHILCCCTERKNMPHLPHHYISNTPIGISSALGDKWHDVLTKMVTIMISWLAEHYVVSGVTSINSITSTETSVACSFIVKCLHNELLLVLWFVHHSIAASGYPGTYEINQALH